MRLTTNGSVPEAADVWLRGNRKDQQVLQVEKCGSASLSLWDAAQYRFLRRFFPGEGGANGSAYAGKSKLRTLLGTYLMEELLQADRIVDFGCGAGAEAVELARMGCKVTGVDIQADLLAQGRKAAQAAGVSDRCTFVEQYDGGQADAVISIDAFEHYSDPREILRLMGLCLRAGGKLYTSFGPTWRHPLGGHLFSVFPWSHLIFSEAAQIAWRSHLRSDGATRFEDVAGGLNQMTIDRFEHIVSQSEFSVERLECVPIRRLGALHRRSTRELTTAIVRAVMVRN